METNVFNQAVCRVGNAFLPTNLRNLWFLRCKRWAIIVLLTLSVLAGLLLFCTATVQAKTDNPHVIKNDTSHLSCKTCHVSDVNSSKSPFNSQIDEPLNTKNNATNLSAFNINGITMCTGCHDPNAVHKVGLHIDFAVPADLPLDESNGMICLTCHYTHGSLVSDRPQASFSFIDQLIDAERLHKSFLLRRSNVNGELCLICHHVSEGSK